MSNNLYKNIWARVAGNATNIKAGDSSHWRIFINKTGQEIPLRNWKIASGEATVSNFITGSAQGRDENGLFAWIDLFGNVSIEDGLAIITLLPVA